MHWNSNTKGGDNIILSLSVITWEQPMPLSKDTIARSESLADFPFEQVIGSGGLAIVWNFCFFIFLLQKKKKRKHEFNYKLVGALPEWFAPNSDNGSGKGALRPVSVKNIGDRDTSDFKSSCGTAKVWSWSAHMVAVGTLDSCLNISQPTRSLLSGRRAPASLQISSHFSWAHRPQLESWGLKVKRQSVSVKKKLFAAFWQTTEGLRTDSLQFSSRTRKS